MEIWPNEVCDKLISRKQSEEPESTNPSKFSRTNGEWRVVHNELELVRVVIPKCGIGSPACLKQSAPGEMRGLLTLPGRSTCIGPWSGNIVIWLGSVAHQSPEYYWVGKEDSPSVMGKSGGLMVLFPSSILSQELPVPPRSLELTPVLALKFSGYSLARYIIFIIYFCPANGISRNHCQSLTWPSSGPQRRIGLRDWIIVHPCHKLHSAISPSILQRFTQS